MAIVSFQTLREHYPYPEKLSHDALFDELGWGKDLKENPEYDNTCAIRMSYCLVSSGVDIRGGFNILKEPHKNKKIETSQKKLTEYIKNHLKPYVGTVQKLNKADKNNFLVNRKTGIISFMSIEGYSDTSNNPSGHIDLIWSAKDSFSIFGFDLYTTYREECGSHCYWDRAKELLFWELK